MSTRDIKPENCSLCRRPLYRDGIYDMSMCAADQFGVDVGYALECRFIALRIAALVAPVVEAAEEYFDNDDSLLDGAVRAMRDGLAKLGTP